MLSNEQIEKMSDEARAKYLARVKKVKRNRRILTVFISAVVIVGIAAALSLTVLFNISSISVKNKGNIYTEQEILSASGIDVGDNMLRTDFKAAANRIETMLPYIFKAEIKKSLSGAVTLTVKDNTASIIFAVKNGYAVADKQGKVLELVPEIPEDSTLMVLKTKNELTAAPGDCIGFSDEYEKELYDELCKSLSDVGLYEGITEIDISDSLNMSVIYQGRLRIKLGNSDNLADKLSGAAKAIEIENSTNPNTVAEVNATIPKEVYVNPLESLDEPEPTEPTNAQETDEKPTDEDGENTSQEDDDSSNKKTELSDENNSSDGDADESSDEEGGNGSADGE